MPSLASIYLREQMRLLKPLTAKMSIKQARAGQDALGELGTKVNANKLNMADVPFGRFEARFISPKKDCKSEYVILYLHGGAYTAGNIKYAGGFGSVLALETGRKVLCVAYRLAPEHPFPAALEDSVASYNFLLSEGYKPENIAFVGESAGGGLVFALALKLQELNIPLPSAFVGISPWSDLTMSGRSYAANAESDPTLSYTNLQNSVQMYCGDHDVNDPLISPLFGEYAALPPSLIFVGTDELLLDDARSLADRITSGGNRCELIEGEGMWHVYPLFSTPEGAAALDKISQFLEESENPK